MFSNTYLNNLVYNNKKETMQQELAGYVKGDGNLKLMLIRNAGE